MSLGIKHLLDKVVNKKSPKGIQKMSVETYPRGDTSLGIADSLDCCNVQTPGQLLPD
jgi:hypothetical protein